MVANGNNEEVVDEEIMDTIDDETNNGVGNEKEGMTKERWTKKKMMRMNTKEMMKKVIMRMWMKVMSDGSRTSIPCPSSIFLYNKYMSGVDNNDQPRGYYSVRTKGKKSYKYIWWFVFDVAVTNMYILAKHHSPASIKSVKQFRASLASAIISNYNSRKQRGRSVSSATPSHRFLFRSLSEKSREKRSMSLLLSHEEKTA